MSYQNTDISGNFRQHAYTLNKIVYFFQFLLVSEPRQLNASSYSATLLSIIASSSLNSAGMMLFTLFWLFNLCKILEGIAVPSNSAILVRHVEVTRHGFIVRWLPKREK